MPPELQLQQRLSQQLVMTPQLQQAIKLLALSHLEMADALAEEAMANPILELEEPRERVSSAPEENTDAEPALLWEGGGRHTSSSFEGPTTPDARLACHPTLVDALFWQLTMAKLTAEEQALTNLIVEEIQDNGRVPEDLVIRLHQATGSTPSHVSSALKIVQDLEPAGVAARSLVECLSLQARRRFPSDAVIIEAILTDHLRALERHQFAKIARALKTTEDDIRRVASSIRRLDPYPGISFGQKEALTLVPDVYVRKRGDAFDVVLNEENLPTLRIHEAYSGRLSQNLDDKTRTYVQEKVREANFFLKSVAMRKKTLIRVTTSIVRFQKDFFDKGPKYLKPLVMRDVASEVELHESTISRVTSNKYVHTALGIFELKYFFNSSIRSLEGEGLASEAVRGHIAKLIGQENPKSPYSDQRLVEILRAQDVDIARRTVAKYREMLKIPSSARRRRA